MAITQTYVDFATGNDYIGASFTDGAFTVADMTLTKAGAFAAASPDHWLYLADNGSGEVTPGYYKVVSKTSDNAVVLAASPKSGANDPTDVVCAQATGAIGSPFRSVQGALDLVTRDSTNGDQLNIKAGTTQDLANTLELDEYGAPANGAPLVLRGYTAVENDGGRGYISIASGSAIINSSTLDFIHWIDLDLRGGGNPTRMITLDDWNLFLRCKFFHPGGNAYCMTLGDNNRVLNCWIGDDFLGNTYVNNYNVVSGCFGKCKTGLISAGSGNTITGNAVYATASIAISADINDNYVAGNIVYYGAAYTGRGISLGSAAGRQNSIAINNIVCGVSGVGGGGIGTIGGDILWAGHNAFWNNTANYIVSDVILVDDTANDVQLLADPFVDAAAGDFSLTPAAKVALADAGWPTSYLDAHANTVPHLNIGPIQMEEADYPAEDDVEAGVSYGGGTHEGDLVVPVVGVVIEGTGYGADGTERTGTYHPTQVAEVLDSVSFGAASAETGTYHAPDDDEVVDTAVFGPASAIPGTFTEPGAGNVEAGVQYGGDGIEFTGTFAVPAEAVVKLGETYGAAAEFTGTYAPAGAADWSDAEKAQIRQALGVTGDVAPTSGAGTLDAVLADTDDIGVAGAGLTALGDARLDNLDAAVSSRATPGDVQVSLAVSATEAAAAATGSMALTLYGSFDQTVTSTTTEDLTTADELIWAIKERRALDADADALVLVRVGVGLEWLAGAAPAAPVIAADGALTLGGVAGAWTLRCQLDSNIPGALAAWADKNLDTQIKAIFGDVTVNVWEGKARISQQTIREV